MEEQLHQPHPEILEGMPEAGHPTGPEQHYKVLSVRIDEGLHAQLRFIAQLSGTNISEEIRTAIEQRITAAQDDADLIARAQQARQEIEREAAARSAAIAGFIGKPATGATATPAAKNTRARRSSTTNKNE